MMIFAVIATTTTVPLLRVEMLVSDFNARSGLSSGFSGFWEVFAKTTFGKIKSSGFPNPAYYSTSVFVSCTLESTAE
jgi:hypothetical protein